MPIWPFNLRRRKTMNDQSTTQPLSEKSNNLQAHGNTVTQQPQEVPRRRSSARRKRRASQQDEKAETIEDKDTIQPASFGKENIEGGFRRRESKDEITALPVKWKLEHSPHLRPVDSERAQIPYNFHNHATSQTSVGRTEGSTSRPGTLRSKRSTVDGTPVRRKSSRKGVNERLREEEIRAMSATMPLPKRPGEAAPRKDSYKRRTFNGDKESMVSLPRGTDDPTLLAQSPTAVEQSSWEVRHFWVNPRPAVRLSQIPAYTLEIPADTSLPLTREMSKKVKDKSAVSKESKRYRTVGDEADILDSNDLRALLERDTKRREKRDRERQERLDRKLRAIEKPKDGSKRRNKDDDINTARDGKRRQDEDFKAIEAGVQSSPRPDIERAKSSVHPALRDEPMFSDDDAVGLGIEKETENPFETPVATPLAEDTPALIQDVTTPFEDPVIQTAREVRMSTAITPPLSPAEGRRRSSVMQIEPLPPRVTAASPSTAARRSGSESKDRRAGAWASFFRRGGTQKETSSAEMSFANTSRESMGARQAVPLHLVTSRESVFQRSASGAPTRTQSKFREDLPDAPLSPPDSRVQSPELPSNAAAMIAAATASTTARASGEDAQAGAQRNNLRSDTPVSPIRGHGMMSASLASVDSEGSWLASGVSNKRASAQSGLSRGYGSLTRRTPEFNASFEDLGETGDKDAEYVQRTTAEARRSTSALAGASVEEEPEQAEVHESVRRKPTLVHRDPAVRSREGLLSEFISGEGDNSAIKDDSADEDELVSDFTTTSKVQYGVRHARQVSAGSAKLLDVAAPRRMSTTPTSPTTTTTTKAE